MGGGGASGRRRWAACSARRPSRPTPAQLCTHYPCHRDGGIAAHPPSKCTNPSSAECAVLAMAGRAAAAAAAGGALTAGGAAAGVQLPRASGAWPTAMPRGVKATRNPGSLALPLPLARLSVSPLTQRVSYEPSGLAGPSVCPLTAATWSAAATCVSPASTMCEWDGWASGEGGAGVGCARQQAAGRWRRRGPAVSGQCSPAPSLGPRLLVLPQKRGGAGWRARAGFGRVTALAGRSPYPPPPPSPLRAHQPHPPSLPPPPPPPLTRSSRVCKDVNSSAQFYRDVLGFLEVQRPSSFDFEGSWLWRFGLGIHLIAVRDWGASQRLRARCAACACQTAAPRAHPPTTHPPTHRRATRCPAPPKSTRAQTTSASRYVCARGDGGGGFKGCGPTPRSRCCTLAPQRPRPALCP